MQFHVRIFPIGLDVKSALELANGVLEYKDNIIYLGVLFSDMEKSVTAQNYW